MQSDIPEDKLDRALMLKSLVTSRATGVSIDDSIYFDLRRSFVKDEGTKRLLPEFIRTCRDQGSLWSYLKSVAEGGGAYAARRLHIDETFQPLLEELETPNSAPSDAAIDRVINSYDGVGVQEAWRKALDRHTVDPQGAITMARTLLEEVCKHILDDAFVSYDDSWDLPKLNRETMKILNLAPSQHTEEVFKAILGSCTNIVESIGSLRNRISDAHALGRRPIKPAARHAALTVNLAGSMSMFFIETLEDVGTKQP